MAEAARADTHTMHQLVASSANRRVESFAAMLPRDAGLQYACTTRERHHRACVHALLSFAPYPLILLHYKGG